MHNCFSIKNPQIAGMHESASLRQNYLDRFHGFSQPVNGTPAVTFIIERAPGCVNQKMDLFLCPWCFVAILYYGILIDSLGEKQMLGVLVNTGTVVVGSLIGLLIKKGVPERITKPVMTGIGLCTMYIGWSGAMQGQNTLILIISMVVGIVMGQLLDLDAKLARLAGSIERRFHKRTGGANIVEGFVTASLLFCVGAMTVVGSLQAGLTGDNTTLFTKATLDFVSSLILASTLGVGVLCAGAFVLVFQGALVLLAQFVAPYLGDAVVAEMTCVGSVLIFALGLNLVGLTKIKVMNFFPAIFLPILLCLFM